MADLDVILRELRGFRQENNEKLETIKDEISKINTRLDEAENRIEQAEERIQTTEDVVTEMLKLHMKLEDKLTDLESRSRRDNIRIYGVCEGAEKDSTMASFVEKLLREGLQLSEEEVPDLHIERAHRSLGPRPPAGAPPRSIIVKFGSFKSKDSLLRKAWQMKGFKWMDKQVNLDHDYPLRIINKRREYAGVRRVLKENQVQFQTLFPARLRVKYTDEIKVYDSAADAVDDLRRRGYAVKTTKAPESLMEQIKQLTWTRADRSTTRSAPDPVKDASYKEKLRAFRRPSPGSSVE